MKKLVLFVVIFLSGCSSIHLNSATELRKTRPLWMNVLMEDLHTGAELIEISYYEDYQKDKNKKEKNTSAEMDNIVGTPRTALKAFNARGLDATYFSPDKIFDRKYPEVFILSQRKSNAITLLFVGTNSINDWIQNAKSTNFEDIPCDEKIYIPAGHAGFRRGIMNLDSQNFFTETLKMHVENYGVKNTSGNKIKVHLIGHSQGGGIAQLIAPVVDGCFYKNGNIVNCRKGDYIVEKIFAYGVPYAVSTDREEKDWHYMNINYGDITYMVLKDADLVAAIYNAYKYDRTVPARHYGNYIRITRDNEVIQEETKWGEGLKYKDQPHYIKNYTSALKKKIKNK